mmetsp:Transcript_86737/g.245973  ORF Transcript_86737/g.245973 Transcript_86737/m.245973 type:complete len:285 (-) Transcript_86737:473-1327(-)
MCGLHVFAGLVESRAGLLQVFLLGSDAPVSLGLPLIDRHDLFLDLVDLALDRLVPALVLLRALVRPHDLFAVSHLHLVQLPDVGGVLADHGAELLDLVEQLPLLQLQVLLPPDQAVLAHYDAAQEVRGVRERHRRVRAGSQHRICFDAVELDLQSSDFFVGGCQVVLQMQIPLVPLQLDAVDVVEEVLHLAVQVREVQAVLLHLLLEGLRQIFERQLGVLADIFGFLMALDQLQMTVIQSFVESFQLGESHFCTIMTAVCLCQSTLELTDAGIFFLEYSVQFLH